MTKHPASERTLQWLIAGAIAVLCVCVFLAPSAVQAGSRVQVTTTPPTPAPTPTPPPGGNPIQNIVQNITQLIRFDFQEMLGAVVAMANNIVSQAYSAAATEFSTTLRGLIFGDYGIAPNTNGEPPLFSNLIWAHWQVTLALAALLLPVTLALTAIDALKQGAESVLSLTLLKEGLMSWGLAAGSAAASYYALSLAYRLSTATALSLLQTGFGGEFTVERLQTAVFDLTVVSFLAARDPAAATVAMYLGFFLLFLASTIVIGLGLALAAFTALTYALTVIAPLVIVIGQLPPLRWLYGLWVKAVTIVILIPPTDALLLKAAASLGNNILGAQGAGNWGDVISGVVIAAGVIAVLIAINSKVAETVYGALGEVHHRAWGATMGVWQLALGAGAFLAGSAALGMTGSFGKGVMASGASEGPMAAGVVGDGAVTGNVAGAANIAAGYPLAAPRTSSLSGRLPQLTAEQGLATSLHRPAPAYPAAAAEQMRRSQLAQAFGRLLHRSRDPLLGAIGTGLYSAGALASHEAGSRLDEYQADRTELQEERYQENLAHRETREALQDQRYTEGQQMRLAEQLRREHDSQVRDMLRWSERAPASLPAEAFAAGRSMDTLLAGSLHRGLMDQGLATRPEDVLAVTRHFMDAWRSYSSLDLEAGQRATIFEGFQEAHQARSETDLHLRLHQVAARLGFQDRLGPELEASVRTLYRRAERITDSPQSREP